MKILKYPLDLRYGAIHPVDMPIGAIILTVQVQYGVPCVWALCDDALPKVRRHIVLYGTGQDLPNNPGKYIGTVQFNNGGLVFHVFDATL